MMLLFFSDFRYKTSHVVPRSFHVSPFNNRSGVYEVHLSDLSVTFDLLLIIKSYISPNETRGPNKHLLARVRGNTREITLSGLIALMIEFPMTALLTIPRIFFETLKLAYQKQLQIYRKPVPFDLSHGPGKTIVWKDGDTLER